MKFSILIPHFKNGKVTAYAVSQLLRYRGNHDIDIIVIDNFPNGSIDYVKPFLEDILVVEYPKDKLSSHGIAFDFVLRNGLVKSDYFICMESDSFPTSENWINYYVDLIDKGYDSATSLLRLSGGTYNHPCGALYKKSNWIEAHCFFESLPYRYFPNMSMKEGFSSHLMVHDSIFNKFIINPDDYVELSESYKPYNADNAIKKCIHYSPTCGVFHNGMGNRNESIHTYGQRTNESEAATMFFDGKMKLINRIGAEPGQAFSWWHRAMNKKVFDIPTIVKWLYGHENQQQQYTLMENGFMHLWAGTAYLDMKDTSMHDVYEFKKNQIEQLYNSLPEHQKIKV